MSISFLSQIPQFSKSIPQYTSCILIKTIKSLYLLHLAIIEPLPLIFLKCVQTIVRIVIAIITLVSSPHPPHSSTNLQFILLSTP